MIDEFDQTAVEPRRVDAPSRELPPEPKPVPAAKRPPATILAEIDEVATRLLGGRARAILRLTAELRSRS